MTARVELPGPRKQSKEYNASHFLAATLKSEITLIGFSPKYLNCYFNT